MSEPLPHVEVRELTMAFGARVVQQDISFRIGHGEIFVIMGAQRMRQEHVDGHMIGLNRPALVDEKVFEPSTPALRTRCSPS